MIETEFPVDAHEPLDIAELHILQRSGVFDGCWFLERNPDLRHAGADPLGHFHRYGWREDRWPNAYFDPAWYVAQNRDVRASGLDPLLHYVEHGEAEGRRPIAWFDPPWYRERHRVPAGVLCLAHFLQHRAGGDVSPVPEFDAGHYLRRYPDVREAGMDPFEHYLVRGAAEDREPSGPFDPLFYRARYLRHQPGAIPLLHYRQNRHLPGIFPTRPDDDTDIPREVRRNTRPGPLFEEAAPPPAGRRRAMLLAFYLPQFHPVPENDAWWGKGFTEWTNVGRGLPRFAGHYQPRIPRDLGHYRLEGAGMLRQQASMARSAGLHGFVFYFYWFDGRRMLDGPLEALLADRSIDLPFCLMWANENWTRRWDGSEHEVLLAQDYRRADEAALVATFVRHFADPRYIRLQGRPVLMVYRAGLIPAGAVSRWRRLFAAAGENPLFVMAQSFGDRDPRPMGMDAAVEFPPHKLTDGIETINAGLSMLDHDATARVFSYDEMAAASDLAAQPFPLIRTAVPGWDNDARREGAGMTVHGATPAAYQAWLERLVGAACDQPVFGEALVCINAWNEWAEGAYLEPDVHFGAAFLNATARAVAGASRGETRTRVLLVGHDAFPAGAQLLLLNLVRTLQRVNGVEVAVLLLGDGGLLAEYRAAAPVTVLPGGHDLARQAASLAAQGFRTALVNTAVAAGTVAALTAAGIGCTLLVHEMPRLLRERGLVETAREGAGAARQVVFAAAHVRDRFAELAPMDPARAVVLPQGVYRLVQAVDRAARRAQLQVPEDAVLGVALGYADLRKGFDLFLQVWRAAQRLEGRTHLLWVGDIDPFVLAYLGGELAIAAASGTFHHVPFSPDGGDWLAAADVHLLTSREDPLPTVVLEAMAAGVPTVAFEESGGVPDLLRDRRAGVAVPLGDAASMARRMRALALRPGPAARAAMAERARRDFDFGRYAGGLLRLACPGMREVSVVVPSFDYERFLPGRLASIFAQTHPVAEVIVLDDASTDGSEAVVARAAAEAGRAVRWVGAGCNSGSVFRQWRRAAALARGEWLWIAEADDLSEPGFLGALCRAIEAAPDVVMAFCDSRAVDAAGAALWPDHQAYYARSGAGLLAQDGVFDAAEALEACLGQRNLILNASAVLFRRTVLLAALDRCAEALDGFDMAGDWRAYAEVLAGGGRVAYVASPLNVHRRHAASVTRRLSEERHLDEITRMQGHMRTVLGRRAGLARGQRQALSDARRALREGRLAS